MVQIKLILFHIFNDAYKNHLCMHCKTVHHGVRTFTKKKTTKKQTSYKYIQFLNPNNKKKTAFQALKIT